MAESVIDLDVWRRGREARGAALLANCHVTMIQSVTTGDFRRALTVRRLLVNYLPAQVGDTLRYADAQAREEERQRKERREWEHPAQPRARVLSRAQRAKMRKRARPPTVASSADREALRELVERAVYELAQAGELVESVPTNGKRVNWRTGRAVQRRQKSQ